MLAGLLESEKAMSAYELADYCKAEFGEAMPAMSVYRILDFLAEKSKPRKSEALAFWRMLSVLELLLKFEVAFRHEIVTIMRYIQAQQWLQLSGKITWQQ